MTKRESRPPKSPGLRRRAEEQLRAHERLPASAAESGPLVRELQIHQLELEMQNEELCRSQVELEAALTLYSELYDFAPVGYFTLGRDGTVHRANLTGARQLGGERSRVVGRRLGIFVAEADRRAFNAALARAFAGQARQSCEVELAGPPGASEEPTYVELTLAVAAGAEECRAVAVDVTERRRTEELLRGSQKMEAIGRLAGGVAHDFNNLLTIILIEADAALRAFEVGESPRPDLLELKEAAQRAVDLTHKLLTFARREAHQPQLVDVNELTRGLASMLRTLLGERIELVLGLAADLERIEIDPAQLEQVIVNLVVNAHDAMPAGGRLTLSTANVDRDGARRPLGVKPGSYVVLTVTDTGAGMDRETMAHIFEPFFTTKERGRGTGFGLATVSGIVEQSGGEIAVHSEPGKGTRFDLYLLRAETQSAVFPVAVARRKTPPPAGGSETVLVVDDEQALRRIVKRVLEEAGYTVLEAGSGAEALRICERHSGAIHLLVSDVVMPQMTGAQLAEHLKVGHPETRILFMSGYTDDALGRAGALDPGVRFIGKPFSATGLKAEVREVLDTADGTRGVARGTG